MITVAPLLPVGLVAVLAVALTGIACWVYLRTPAMLALRLVAVGIITLVLLNPVGIPPATSAEMPRLALVVDASASMGLVDDVPSGSRLAQADKALAQVAATVGGRFTVEWWSLSSELAPGRPTAAAGGTSFDPLAAFAARPPSAIILASDGAERGTQDPDQALAAAGVPVSCIAIGSTQDGANLALRLDAPSPTAFPGQDLQLSAAITCTPGLVGRQVELTLTPDAGQPSRQIITLADGALVQLPVAVGDEPGERVWTAALAALDGEASAEDNRSSCAVRVVDRHLNLVVVEGRPWWDSAVAVRAWRRDRQLATVAHWRAGARKLGTAADDKTQAPAPDAAAIAAADLIVLGLEPERVLDQAAVAAIPAAVAGGAGLLLLAPGPRDALLDGLDPVLWTTETARDVRAVCAAGAPPLLPADLLAGLPTVLALGADGLRPGTSLLLGEAARPLVAMRRHGAGRVIAVNAEGLWRWSLGREEDAAGRLWRQLARLAVRDAGGLSADRARYRVSQSARIAGSAAEIAVTAPDGRTSRLPLADGGATLPLDAPGLWRLAAGADRLSLPVHSDQREQVETARRDRRLERLAGATGGTVVEAAAATALAERLVRRAELMAEAPRPHPLIVAWWWWVIALAALLAAEWWLRRSRHGRI